MARPRGSSAKRQAASDEEVRFEYRKRTYIHAPPSSPVDDEATTFGELTMPVGLPISTYLKASSGLRGEALEAARHRYGANSFAIPGRTFGSLFVEHALAPFFVFQLFCVTLWSLDDYWYYSLFTLAMLVVFESTVVTARLRNLDEMRELATPPCAALAYRDGKWRQLSSEDLLPGDLVALARAESSQVYSYNGEAAEVEAACPADVVLLHGSVTVNESALTGESTPMLKSPLATTAADAAGGAGAPLSMSAHKASIVLGGTKILQHAAGGQPSALQPPGGGAVGYVVRTGFYSSQGELIRTILFASARGADNGRETIVFICLLLSFAVAAAAYVLHEGLHDPTRSRWKLLLHCVMILTSVVPPELPMELSLAVNNSLLALHRLSIYCTEPFRIPFAGKCHVCCFDKTGTLTLSELIVEGVALPDADTAAGGDDEGRATGTGTAVDGFTMAAAADAPLATAHVLAGCHQLVRAAGGRLLGDPMEKAALDAAGWTYQHDGSAVSDRPLRLPSSVAAPGAAPRAALRILKRFPFSSELKRSAAVIETVLVGGDRSLYGTEPALRKAVGLRVVAKGSPEAIRTMLTVVPRGYDATYRRYAATGKRVLALATKRLDADADGSGAAAAQGVGRADAECDLEFCGFLVLHCPPRPESKEVLAALSTSGHTLQMLTGDALLTATHTATELGLAKPPPILSVVDADNRGAAAAAAGAAGASVAKSPSRPGGGASTPIEKYINRKMERAFSKFGVAQAARPGHAPLRWSLWEAATQSGGGGGGGGTTAAPPTAAWEPPPFDPSDAAAFRELARTHDLCVGGDGFAALEARGLLPSAMPHLRVLARMSPAQKETALTVLHECGLVTMMCGDGTNDVGALRQSDVSVALVSASLVAPPPPPPPSASASAASSKESAAEKQQRKLQECMEALQQPPSVKLGDASVAAAFTARSANVTSCVDIITQGRCTLVTTTQMFKILSLNCLISAYGLSVLHGAGVRMSDAQATATGLTTAALFLFLSFAQPLGKLAPQRPPPSALAPSVLLSIGGQFAVHLRTIVNGFRLGADASRAAAEPPPEPDGDFEPTITNTVVFLLSASMLLTTFATNYTGKPFMGALSSNRGLAVTLLGGAAVTYLLATGALPDLAAYLELVPLPDEPPAGGGAAERTEGAGHGGLATELVGLMFFDAALCYAIGRASLGSLLVADARREHVLGSFARTVARARAR